MDTDTAIQTKVCDPKVSVVIPTCNRKELLARSIESVANQTYHNIELIVVNDAGESVEDVVYGISRGREVIYIEHDKNRGASAARNAGMKVASGDYIAFLDDDDSYLPHHIETLLAALRVSKCFFGYSYAEYVIEGVQNGEKVHLGRTQPYSDSVYSKSRLLAANYIPTPTWMFARCLIDKVGYFDEQLLACEDWDWLIRASDITDFLCLERVTVEVNQRLYDGQHLIIQHGPKMRTWIEIIYKKHPVVDEGIVLAREENLKYGPIKRADEHRSSELIRYENELNANKLSPVDLINYVSILTTLNQRHKGVHAYSLWLQLNSEHPLRWAISFNLAVALYELNQIRQAIHMCQQAINLNPKHQEARHLMNLIKYANLK